MNVDIHTAYRNWNSMELESAMSEYSVRDAEKFVVKKLAGVEVETDDQESTGSSSEEMESPRSVAKDMKIQVHSQILRLRAEDSHIGEDIREFLRAKYRLGDADHVASVMIFSRPVLPASPLSGKASVKPAY